MRWRSGTAFASSSLTSKTTSSSLIRLSSIVSTWCSCSNMGARRHVLAILGAAHLRDSDGAPPHAATFLAVVQYPRLLRPGRKGSQHAPRAALHYNAPP